MFTPTRDTPPKGESFRSPLSVSPFSSSSNAARVSGRPKLKSASRGPYESSLISARGQAGSITIEEAPTHKVLSYGQSLPVQVSEALTSRDSGIISCKLGPNGWAWLVKGNKLLIWKYVPSAISKAITCFALHLPSTELYHKADLTTVVSTAAGDAKHSSKDLSASVLSVSPEGLIRMWPDFANPGIYLEAQAGLKGKEFSVLASLPPHGCVVITTSNDILLIVPSRSSLICRLINDTSGLLSGFGRRMSSFLLGSSSSHPSIHLPKIAVGPANDFSAERCLYVLANGTLQKWEIGNGKEKLLSQVDLIEKLKEEILRTIEIENGSLEKIIPLDIASAGYCLAILCCAVVRTHELKGILFLGTKKSSGADLSSGFESFIPLEYSLDIENENSIPSVGLLIPAGSYQAFIHSRDFITANPVSEVREGLVEIGFPNEMSKLVGGGSYGNDCVFLSKRHGLFTVIPSHRDSVSSVLQPEISMASTLERSTLELTENQSRISQTRNKTDAGVEQNIKQLIEKAFLEHCSGNIFEAREIIAMLPLEANIDEAVVAISEDIIDSTPVSDPRWAQHSKTSSQLTSNSVLIMKQLEDKERVFDFFMKFLEDVDIYSRLTVCKVLDTGCYTKFKLCEHAEKLSSAKALQAINLNEVGIMQKVIQLVVNERGGESTGINLSEQDIFFREVSKVQDLFGVLSQYEQESLDAMKSTKDQINLISSTNIIAIAALKSAWLYRQSKASYYQPDINEPDKTVEFVPWTSGSGTCGIRSTIRNQISLTVEKALPYVDIASVNATLLQQMVDLADLLLDGYVTQLQFVNDSTEAYNKLKSEFEKERTSVIQPLFDQENYKMAEALAEKYEDFAFLVMICDRENDAEKLEKHKSTFAEKGFLDFLFQWYMDRGQWGKLLDQGSSTKLEAFLQSHNHLQWLHYIGIADFNKASTALLELAKNETTFLARKKTMLSIAKLCLFASSQENTGNVTHISEEIQNQLDIILHQETLPSVVIENSGMEPDNMPPLSVEDLIQLYTGEENVTANEFDFKRALDLVSFVTIPSEKEHLWNQTWERAILKNNIWMDNITTDPLVRISETVFYKCAKLFENEVPDILTILPGIDDLKASKALQQCELSGNNNFLFLIQAFYESLAAMAI